MVGKARFEYSDTAFQAHSAEDAERPYRRNDRRLLTFLNDSFWSFGGYGEVVSKEILRCRNTDSL